MYSESVELPYENELPYEPPERTSDIQLPGAINLLLLAIWAAICLIGFVVIFLSKRPIAGTVIIAVPTFIGMVIKPTFALCTMMLVMPTGMGVAYRRIFSLERGLGMAVAASFALNLLISRPRLRIGNRALWVIIIYTIWVFLRTLGGPYVRLELVRAFTQVQLLVLTFIVYWILETNSEKTFRWALRSYIVGALGTIAITFITGAAMRSLVERPEERYRATLGALADPNVLAVLMGLAFLAAVYLIVRDRGLFWKPIYLVTILFMPIMMIRTGSRGALIAMVFTLMLPLLFVRQVSQKPVSAFLVFVVIILVSGSAAFLVRTRGLEEGVSVRLTDIQRVREAVGYRMYLIRTAIQTALRRPAGTTHTGWYEMAGTYSDIHNDLFYALGVYGIPGFLLIACLMIMMMFSVKRIPLGIEKLYARAVLTFLLVTGLNIGQLFHKHFWVFLVFVMASDRIAKSYTPINDLLPRVEYDDRELLEERQVDLTRRDRYE